MLESSVASIVLDVSSGFAFKGGYGSIFISDSDGKYFVKSLANSNRASGTVDYERIHDIEGILLANIVTNTNELGAGKEKQIESRISFNNGGSWQLIPPPAKNTGDYSCVKSDNQKPTDQCALHLHSVSDPQKIIGSVYSSKKWVLYVLRSATLIL